jgi:uncharacterized glyoxalase superfamily protein PhnB
MKLLDTYPLIVTRHREACRDFYTRHFGFEVRFDSSWFTYLHRPATDAREVPASLAFMDSDHPSAPPGPEVFAGSGALLSLQVEDATAFELALRESGVEITYAVRREPWGQVRFECVDPAGLVLDICEQVEPQAGYWERFAVGAARK